jgi:CubicO group peptidase (beta-lactamase class C family)
MISTLLDLKTWAEALGTGSLVTSEIQQARIGSLEPMAFDPCDDNDPERAPKACPEYDKYGWGLGELDGWIGHTGEGLGYTVLVMFEPESAAVIVIMMNRSGAADHVHVPTKMFREYVRVLAES